jgi:membrane fusion protein (multidrug efflux system)
VALGLLVPLNGCENSKSDAKQAESRFQGVRVKVVKVEPKTIRDVVVLPGETEARHDVLLAAEREGRVEWVGPREGQSVKKGELIAKIDVAALQAALERAKAAYKLAEEVAGRRESLKKERIVSQEEFERSDTKRIQALYNLREAEVQYRRGFVRAPISGVVNKLFTDPGEFVRRGGKVAEIVDINRIWINVRVPELDVRYLKLWRNAAVAIDAYPGVKWNGLVDFVSYKADPATKTFKVRVVVDNEDGRIRPGMIAHVAFLRRLVPGALVAPIFAVMDRGGERILFVEKDGIAHARTVSIGIIDGKRVQIVKGLKPGDNLIVSGQHELEEGMRVTLQ